MITPAYVATMAAYNAEMNRRWYAAAAGLTEAQRCQDAAAFFGSLHRTLAHVLWADRMWMSRFAGWPRPEGGFGAQAEQGFDALRAARVDFDARLLAWAGGLTQDWLDGELVWFSGAMQQDMRQPRAITVVHLFNHQAHHRGQAHALLTRFGADPGVTDLPFVL